jgi:hypothetical protein
MKRYLVIGVITLIASLTFVAVALAQSGHFVGSPSCTDEGTTVECRGKVAGGWGGLRHDHRARLLRQRSANDGGKPR